MKKSERENVIEQIECVFMYLGCANLPTQSMDGAVPLDITHSVGLKGDKNGHVAGYQYNPMLSGLPEKWSFKWTMFRGDHLLLESACGCHWSKLSHQFEKAKKLYRLIGERFDFTPTEKFDCFSTLHHSEIDEYGNFIKFPVKWRELGQVHVLQSINPSILYGYKGELWTHLRVDNEELCKKQKLDRANELMISFAATMSAHWLANIAIEPAVPRLTMLTDPTGIAELWKLRDVPEGRKRRAALLNWVSSHWRKDRCDPDMELFVRKHLRGATDLTFKDLKVSITPSSEASVENALHRQDREAMRRTSSRPDRRRRYRKSGLTAHAK